MKVMLIVPPWTILDIRAEDTQGIAGFWPPVGTLYIASVLREAGHTVVFRDGGFYTHSEMLDEIDKENPDVLGAFVIAMFWERTRTLFQDIHKRHPEMFLLAGGHGPSAFGKKALEDLTELDAVVISEAEYTVRDIVARLDAGENLAGVEGCIVRVGNEIVENPARPFIEDLDELPFPAMDLSQWQRYIPSYGQVRRMPSFQVISSRGCMNDCLYCYRLMGRNVLRFRSPKNVVDDT